MKLDSADFSGLEDHFRNMDASKVDMQLLSVSGQLPYFAQENDAVDAARLGNDIYARLVRENRPFRARLPRLPARAKDQPRISERAR